VFSFDIKVKVILSILHFELSANIYVQKEKKKKPINKQGVHRLPLD
jgi:hypothetical protein